MFKSARCNEDGESQSIQDFMDTLYRLAYFLGEIFS